VEAFPVIARLKLYLAAIAVGFATAWQVIRMIRRNERKDIERERANARVDAMKQAGRIRDDVETDPYIVDRASDWIRKKD
jgi:uncharacterized membrane protein (UPF0182 family)